MNRRQMLIVVAGIVAGAGVHGSAASTPDRGMVEGRFYCERCDRDVAIPKERLHPSHAVADLGDFGRVWLDGKIVSESCKDAMPGRNGWVVVDRWSMADCPKDVLSVSCPDCFSNQVYLLRGNVVFVAEVQA